jgi:E3 ubiquitin-protein ligase XBAT32/33
MQACQYGHWEVVQTLILFNANVSIYILNPAVLTVSWICDSDMVTWLIGSQDRLSHVGCLRLVLADYVPSIPNFCTLMNHRTSDEDLSTDFDHGYVEK